MKKRNGLRSAGLDWREGRVPIRLRSYGLGFGEAIIIIGNMGKEEGALIITVGGGGENKHRISIPGKQSESVTVLCWKSGGGGGRGTK